MLGNKANEGELLEINECIKRIEAELRRIKAIQARAVAKREGRDLRPPIEKDWAKEVESWERR